MQVDLDLTTYLSSLAGTPVEQNKISEDKTAPNMFFRRKPSQTDLFLDGTVSLYETNYDVECYGENIDQVETLCDALRTNLNGYAGAMGETTVLGAFTADHEEDYQSKLDFGIDEGMNVASFSLQLVHI